MGKRASPVLLQQRVQPLNIATEDRLLDPSRPAAELEPDATADIKTGEES